MQNASRQNGGGPGVGSSRGSPSSGAGGTQSSSSSVRYRKKAPRFKFVRKDKLQEQNSEKSKGNDITLMKTTVEKKEAKENTEENDNSTEKSDTIKSINNTNENDTEKTDAEDEATLQARLQKQALNTWRLHERTQNLPITHALQTQTHHHPDFGLSTSSTSSTPNPLSKKKALDSSLKKCNAFIRKLRHPITTTNITSLLAEFQNLNLTRYVSEIAHNLLDGKLKSSDLQPLLNLCGTIYRRYPEFRDLFMRGLIKRLVPPKEKDNINDNGNNGNNVGLGMRKVYLKVLGDLVIVGISLDVAAVLGVVKYLMRKGVGGEGGEKGDMRLVGNIAVVGSWLQWAGDVYWSMGLVGTEHRYCGYYPDWFARSLGL